MPRDNFTMSENSGSFGMQQRQDRFDAIGDLIVGPPGPPGPQGPPGEDGKSAYQSAVDGGYQGTETEFNDELSDIRYAASLARDAADDAEAAAEHYPKIQNGTWWVWDVEQELFVDTGISAQGPKGDSVSLTILSYGHSTWNDFITAYNSRSIVYCRASSGSDPASGSQTRLAIMAYVNSAASPTSVEFQYYRSVGTHTDAQQGDQVFVYKLTSAGIWSVETRNTYTKIVAGENMTSSYANGTLTLNATGGGGGTSDYDDLTGKPSINNVTLSGNKTAADLGLGTYSKPSGGIPASDLASAVQTSLGLADSALQAVPSTYRTAAAQDAIDAGFAKTNEVGIVINGKRPSRNAAAGQYVIVRNSTISDITDGLYVVRDGYTLSPSTDVTAASLSAVNIGGLNFLLSQIEDSGWKNLTLTSDFTLYNSSSQARYRKIGKVVEIQGTLKPTSAIESTNVQITIATLPSGYRPSIDSRIFICQGSGMNRWTLTVQNTGAITISRYGTTEFATIPTSGWLPFDVMFFVD